ncbi:alpha/beta hydrolase [Zooshikella ganghwensis]|uniref:Alpha/beta hydrolase n=1 Tax=Zooshikella ganghwensis TaxID=202772 RepID=A0A4V1INP4_9GAMM|nr:alpha/beta hydrolase [Zooshikella ganghwensis]RDH44441.1 alpha/beta hydrolase [Zooshikella ganghwensis]
MQRKNLMIGSIPAILWGDVSEKLFIVVHGDKSNKADNTTVIFAEEATKLGYQVLSFDLPEHGDRVNETYPCKVQNGIKDLNCIMHYAELRFTNISLFACSMGAYFSLLAYKNDELKQCLFLSPIVDMEGIIDKMMSWFGISEDRLQVEKEISTPIGHTLYWDYYCYVKKHPIVNWSVPTSILYGSEDDISEFEVISSFSNRFNCHLDILQNGEHFFYSEKQLAYFRRWLKDRLKKQGNRI